MSRFIGNTVERTYFGGTLLHLLLQGIIGNFGSTREGDVTVLRLLGYIEDVLIHGGVYRAISPLYSVKKS
jgi:hypothetical protein